MDVSTVRRRKTPPQEEGQALTSRTLMTTVFPRGQRGPQRPDKIVKLTNGGKSVILSLREVDIHGMNLKIPIWAQRVLQLKDCQEARLSKPRRLEQLDLVELARPPGLSSSQSTALENAASHLLTKVKFLSLGMRVDVPLKCGRTTSLYELEIIKLSPNNAFGTMEASTHVNFEKTVEYAEDDEDDED